MGEALSNMPASLNKRSIEVVKENLPNHVPTTWEAIQAEAEEELAKPEGERKLSRAMCLILVAKVPKGQKVAVINPSFGFYTVIKDGMYLILVTGQLLLVNLSSGSTMCFSVSGYPPSAFGTRENPQSRLLVDPGTGEPRRATIMMSYFSPPV